MSAAEIVLCVLTFGSLAVALYIVGRTIAKEVTR